MKKSIKALCMSLALSMALTFSAPVNAFAATGQKGTENFSKETIVETESDKILERSIEQNIQKTGNNYPIVMVHGLFGWGNNELYGYNYWGGSDSLREMLNNEGHTVFTPTLGPVSSNWDRACELYAYLKGGTVDYGQAHAEREGHARFGRTYKGLMPDFGDVDENGNVKKIHLLGHSMGGETSRVLAQLLEQGDPRELAVTGKDTSPLFTGNKHWIDSITTLCTPHDGSQESDRLNNMEPQMHKLFATYASYAGVNENKINLDLQMDQWGLKRAQNESYQDFAKRVFSSRIWKETKDLSVWDLTLQGASELNSWVKSQDDIYYFSIACVDTHKNVFSGHQVPNVNMQPLMFSSGFFMGKYTRGDANGKIPVDKSWWRNDGLVAVRSAIGPQNGSTDRIVDYDGTPERGEWNYMGEIKNIDHLEVIFKQEPIYKNFIKNKYRSWVKMLNNLD